MGDGEAVSFTDGRAVTFYEGGKSNIRRFYVRAKGL
jgi:hypothetical protein